MRVVLISPYADRCFGLRIIASFLRQHGHDVWLIVFKQFTSKPATLEQLEAVRHPSPGSIAFVTEALEEGNYILCTIEPITETEWQLLLGRVAELRPDLIGIGMTSPSMPASREVTQRLKREFPRVPIVWGGIHPTINPEECIQWTDMVCIGEGEHPMAELARDPERTDIAGIWFRKNEEIIRNPIRPLEQDLDVFPFASWGKNEFLIDWNQELPLPAINRTYFRGIAFTMTGRGCPFSCSYCFNHFRKAQHKGERYVRRRSVDHVLAECEQLVRDFGLTAFPFDDDIFVKDREWIEEFADKYPKRIGLPFGGYAHPLLSDETMIRPLVEAGLCFITIGIQTGSQYILREVYKRYHSFESVLRLTRLGEKYGVALNYEFLSNCDYESEADCLETLKLLIQLPQSNNTRVLGLAVFPPMRISALNLPRHSLDERTFDFWNTLYLLTQYRQIPGEQLLALSRDEYLKQHPEILHSLAFALRELTKQTRTAHTEAVRLQGLQEAPSVRGLLRYTKRLIGRSLPRPIADGVRAVLARRKAAKPSETS